MVIDGGRIAAINRPLDLQGHLRYNTASQHPAKTPALFAKASSEGSGISIDQLLTVRERERDQE